MGLALLIHYELIAVLDQVRLAIRLIGLVYLDPGSSS
jgi:hypothetical protein